MLAPMLAPNLTKVWLAPDAPYKTIRLYTILHTVIRFGSWLSIGWRNGARQIASATDLSRLPIEAWDM